MKSVRAVRRTGLRLVWILPLLLIIGYIGLRGAAPSITQISPAVGQAGDVVTITGSGFPSNPVVLFGPNRAAVLTNGATQLTVQVPNGQPLGPASVTVSSSNSLTFIAASRSKIVAPPNPSLGSSCGQACNCKAADQKSCSCDQNNRQCTCGEANSSKCVSQGISLGGNMDGTGGSIYGERGEFYQESTDLSIPGRPGGSCAIQYSLQREYRSDSVRSGPMGNKWDLNSFESLELEGDGSVMYHNGNGRNDHYLLNNLGNFVAPPDFYTTLVKNSDGSFTMTYRNRTVKNFDKTGKIENTTDRDGNTMSYTYNAQNQLTSVSDSLGRPITYSYDGSGRLTSVTDFIGRTATYTYDANNNLISATTPPVTGTPNGNDFPTGRTTRYTYDSNHNLLTVTRPNEVAAGGPASLTNTYNASGQVTQQIHGGTNASGIAAGGTYTYTYTTLNAGASSSDPNLPVMRTQQTDPNGNVTQYDYNRLSYPLVIREFTRGVRPGDPSVFTTNMQYNADGRMTQITLPHGNTVQYVYDAGNPDRFQQGNLLSETRQPDARGGDQSFITTTYTYEPIYNHVQTVTEPRGNDPSFVPQNGGAQSAARYTTTYTYDAAGNMITKQEPTVTLPGGSMQLIETDYTYNSFGQMTSMTDPEGNVTQYQYCPTATPNCSTPDPAGGGYLQTKIVDATTSPRRTESTPPLAITTQYFYDPVGNMIRSIDGRGNDTLYTYNQLNELVEDQSEAPFRYITYTYYDYNGNVVRKDIENKVVVETDGRPTFTGGNFNTADGTPSFFTNRYTYDILDRTVTQDLDATGSTPSRVVTQYRYDHDQNRIQETAPAGNVTTYTFDERNLPYTTTRGFGSSGASTTRYDYDTNRNLADTVDGRGFTTTYTYDGFDRRTQTTDPVGGTTVTHYDPVGNVILQSRSGQPGGASPSNNSGAGNVLLSQGDSLYDELNRRYQYDERPINSTSFVPSGVATIRPPSETTGPLNPGDISTQFIYDRDSRLVQQIGDDLSTTSTTYDGANRRVQVTDPAGNTTALTYDANNNLIQSVDTDLSQKAGVASESFTTTTQYDSHNRQASVSDNCQNTRRTAYDSRDNLTHSTDAKFDGTTGCPGSQNPQGNSTRYIYDGLNRHLQTVEDLRVGGVGSGAIDTSNIYDPSGQITTTAVYDGNGRLTNFTDNNGNTTTYTYDALNRRTQETLADTTSKTYTYDADDNIITLTDNNGTVQTNVYDRLNRLTQTTAALATGVTGTTANTYQYDGLSRTTQATDNNTPSDSTTASTVNFVYDSLSRMVEETQNGRAVDNAWTAQSRRTALTYPNARQLAYTYDSLERVQTIQDSGAPTNLAQYTYMGPGRVLQRQYQNGTQLTYLDNAGTTDVGYDGVRRTIQRRDVDSSNNLLVGFAYNYDRENNKSYESKLHSSTNSELYTYDSANRSTTFARGQLNGSNTAIPTPSKTQAWTLDGVGNWRVNNINGVPESRSVNSVNEYTSINATSETYDHDGNLINDGTLGYQWDYRNRLRLVCFLPSPSATCNTVGASVLAVYSYDAMNRRTKKVVTNSGSLNGTTSFYYSGWRTIEERTGADVLIQQYVYGIAADEPLVLDRNLDGDNSATGPADQRLFYHQNTLNSTFALTDSTGAIAEGYQYDEYGLPTVFAADFSTVLPASALNNPYLFTGQRLDPETGLFYYKNRYYSTTLGRFLSRDRAGYIRGNASVANGTAWELNLYLYGRDEPTRFTDPDGLTEYDVVGVPSDDASLAGEKPRIKRAGGTVLDFANNGNLDDLIAGLADITSQGAISRFFRGQHCIRTLEIHAHANPNVIDGITTDNAAEMGAKLKQRIKWCCPCTIYLAGCNTGLGAMAQRLATATGCTVYGSRGYLSGTHAEGNENCSKECDYEGHHYDAYPGSIDGKGADCWKSFAPGQAEQGGAGGNVNGKKVKGKGPK